jgi:signal transduction histidine kinase
LLFEDRPAMWPNPGAESALPLAIEQALDQAERSASTNSSRAVELVVHAVALARAVPGDGSTLARTLFLAAPVLVLARRPDRAFAMSLEAQPLLESLDEPWRAARMLWLRGQCYLNVSEYERAADLLREAARRFANLHDRVQVGRSYTALARASGLSGDLPKAVMHAARALKLFDRQGGDPQFRRQLQNNEAHWRTLLGRQLKAGRQPQRAQQELDLARAVLPDVDVAQGNSSDHRVAVFLETAIDLHLVRADLSAAGSALVKLGRWARRTTSLFDKALFWTGLARFHSACGKTARAIACARRADLSLMAVTIEPRRIEVQLLLAELLEKQLDFMGAYEALAMAERIEERQQQQAVAMRAELLTLDMRGGPTPMLPLQTLGYAQHLSSLGHMVAGITHELSQPMSSIKMLTDLSVHQIESGQLDEAVKNVAVMRAISGRLVNCAEGLVGFPARAGAGQNSPVSLRQAIGRALEALASKLARSPCTVAKDVPDLWVMAVEDQLVRVLTNLLGNALDAVEDAVEPRAVFRARVEQDYVVLCLADTGHGIPEDVLDRLFQPFFSTKAAGRGLGLGLALSKDAVQAMGGELTTCHGEDGGAVFCITLPAVR